MNSHPKQKGPRPEALPNYIEEKQPCNMDELGALENPPEVNRFRIYIEEKQPNYDGFAFASRVDTNKPLNRFNFTKQCNRVLALAPKDFGKHLRSHSFRATFVTDLLENGIRIETTKEIIGHSDIGTTVRYRRSKIGLKETRKILSSVQRARLVGRKVK